MVEVQLNGEPVALPELRLFHKERTDPNRRGAILAAEDPFGKTWVSCDYEVAAGALFEIEIPTAEESEPYITIRMRAIRPAERSELIAALRKCPHKVLLAKGYWYEVIAD